MGPARPVDVGVVRLMMFNAQHAAPGRARRQAAWIAAQENADLVVVTEVGAGPGGQALVEALGWHGCSLLVCEPAVPDYRAILAARGPALTPVPKRNRRARSPRPGRRSERRRSHCRAAGPVCALPRPEAAAQPRASAPSDAVTAALPGFLAQFSAPVIVAGDFNVVEPGHQPHLPVFGAREYAF